MPDATTAITKQITCIIRPMVFRKPKMKSRPDQITELAGLFILALISELNEFNDKLFQK